jgi:2,3-bisphosphoglycerate-dependent phosphoglycerate mutase
MMLSSCAQDDATTYYLIRHSEKDRTDSSNKNPNLSEKGQKRAANWAEYFKDIAFDAVYSTKYNRTIQTATPTAKLNKLEIKQYDGKKMFDVQFEKETKGKIVLVVGHSNTTPFFANKILKQDKFKEIDDNNNSNLYIVTVTKDSKNGKVLKID